MLEIQTGAIARETYPIRLHYPAMYGQMLQFFTTVTISESG
ncbi:hypothetical protein [Nostoc sp. PA-18-2419]|nr:hypothetical protein [Nostoc sp. PA-18-2419]